MHLRGYRLLVQGALHYLEADQNFAKMRYPASNSAPVDNQVISFTRLDSLNNHKTCKRHALIKVWQVCEDQHRIKCLSRYYFCNPVISKHKLKDRAVQTVVHKTIDGDAYLLKKKANKIVEVCVVNQAWPSKTGALPLEQTFCESLNSLTFDGSKTKIQEFLNKMDISPCNKFFDQIQFLNRFQYLVHSSKNYCKLLNVRFNASVLRSDKY